MSGTVYLVGAGPGVPDLLTVRAVRLLAEADIVFHDALIGPEILLLATKAEKIAVGKRCGRHSTAQQFINKRLLDAARRHKVVVRLKGGDPMLFGRAHEEIQYLAGRGIAVEIIPGVTAALAADTAVLYMPATDASLVKELLIKTGVRADTPVAIAESVSTLQSALHAGKLADLPLLAERLRSGPALTLIGDVFAALQAAANQDLDLRPRTASQIA